MNHIINKKFAAHALLFDSQRWILKMIENCGPYVEKIYVAYSELPWTYNPNARGAIKNTADPSILLDSQYASKIELIRGVWERDEDQRNACLDRAKADGMDFLIIQDADEFYKQRDYSRMIEQIANNPEYDFYKTPWCIFWKSFDYVLEGENGSTVIGFPEVAINCKRNVTFARARTPGSNNYFTLDALCYHGSYVSTDDEMYRKIHTWGHAHQFDRDRWYQNKWLRWTESTEDLHPISPRVFRRAVRYTGDLPEVLTSESDMKKNHTVEHGNSIPPAINPYCVNPDTFRGWMKVGSLIRGENLSEVNYLLNQAYDVEENHGTSYRKIIEVFKETPEKSREAFSGVETRPSTLSNAQQETFAVTASGDGFHEEKEPYSTARREESCPAMPVTKGMVSIVIPTITVNYLAECIQSVEKNTSVPNFEIIIVNDGSSEPEFMEYLASSKHRVINLPNNVGFARANNEGFKAAKGEYIMTLNADTIVHENWLTIMINTLESCKDVAAVGPTVLRAGTQVIETGGCFIDKSNARLITIFLMDKIIQDYPQINTAYRVDTLVGVCMLFRRYALFEVGLFDGNFVNGWEDVDICLSLRDKGYKIYHSPAIIEHYGSVARNKFSREEYVKMVDKNRNHFNVKLRKHAKRLSDIAERLSEKNRYHEAIRYFMMAIETGVDLAYHYYNLAVLYHRNNQIDAAIMCFRKIADLEPHNAHAYNNLGVLYFLKGAHKKAEYYFNKALSLNAGYEEAKQNLVKLRARLKDV